MKKCTLLQKYKIRRKYKKYADMKKEGKSDREVYLAAEADGLNGIEHFEILCNVCDLSFRKAKELMVCTDTGAKSLSEYQEKYVLPALKEAFENEAQESNEDVVNNKRNGQEKRQ